MERHTSLLVWVNRDRPAEEPLGIPVRHKGETGAPLDFACLGIYPVQRVDAVPDGVDGVLDVFAVGVIAIREEWRLVAAGRISDLRGEILIDCVRYFSG